MVRDPDLLKEVNAELAYTAALLLYLQEAEERTIHLLESLEAEYGH